ncbi:Protein CBG27785 [Caenorhabditis briggsae]|uniref:Protein CBG27785 n=2 Tax=Caenorhabditis briggsae TaxID=6238 RepID=B6II22_CAEBR|nr:Protein CBG27785 [Caenorhabditis briggsae]ULT83038.1 hypothetical protein L3Y34_012339 [Caenorhabditis briggsae]CAR99552.1 Protein CBG27785 [Caenorhabditis briggsae]
MIPLPENQSPPSNLPSALLINSLDAPNELSEEEQIRLREEEEEKRRQEEKIADENRQILLQEEQEKEEAEFLAETCEENFEEQRQLTTTMEDVGGFFTPFNSNSEDGRSNKMAMREQARNQISENPAHSSMNLEFKLESERLKKDKKRLEEENRLLKLQIPLNSLFRIEEAQQRCVASLPKLVKTPDVSPMPKGPCEARKPPENMSRECFVKETARDAIYDETMHENFAQDFDYNESEKYTPNRYYQSNWDTGKASETAFLSMMQQMHMQNQLCDPPKYTAEEKTASMDAL